MIKKVITYEDLDGNNVTDTFYFAISKADLLEKEAVHEGGYGAYMQQLGQAKNGGQMVAAVREFISGSVGRRSDDNKRFIKSEDITNEFMQSDAYPTLLMELFNDTPSMIEFFKQIFPGSMHHLLADLKIPTDDSSSPNDLALPFESVNAAPSSNEVPWADREPTQHELQTMTQDQLRAVMLKKFQNPS